MTQNRKSRIERGFGQYASVMAAVAIITASLGFTFAVYSSLPAEPMLMNRSNLGVIWGWTAGGGTLMVLNWWGVWPPTETEGNDAG